MPRMVAMMLRELDVRDGDKLLEIGTGTGWNSALAAHRLGADRVTTVEVNEVFAERAAACLGVGAGGFAPRVVWGDGIAGWEAGAPYQRLVATCAVRSVPYAWVAQTKGVIVTPWGNGMCNGALLRLKSDGFTATGRVVEESSFMWMSGQALAGRPREREGCASSVSRTGLDPRQLSPADVRFAVGLRVQGCRYRVEWGDDPGGDDCVMRLTDGCSLASVKYMPDGDTFPVRQSGPRRLWEEVESAYHWWEKCGRPGFTRWGLSVARDRQVAWLDSPDRVATRSVPSLPTVEA